MDIIDIFTDGACCKQGTSKANGGIGIHVPISGINISCSLNEYYKNNSKFECKHTNQRAELLAIYESLVYIINDKTNTQFRIITDSMYSINCLTKWCNKWKLNGWITSKNESVLNVDIIKPSISLIDDIRNIGKTIEFIHVKGHQTIRDSMDNYQKYKAIGNIKADKLATDCL